MYLEPSVIQKLFNLLDLSKIVFSIPVLKYLVVKGVWKDICCDELELKSMVWAQS